MTGLQILSSVIIMLLQAGTTQMYVKASNLSLTNQTKESLVESFGSPQSLMEAIIREAENTNATDEAARASSSDGSEADTVEAGTGVPSLSLVSHRYNEGVLGNEFIGEVTNNGTEAAQSAEVRVSFYDANGEIVDTSSTFTDPLTIQPGSKAPFTLLIGPSEDMMEEVETYDLALQWRDSDFQEYTQTVVSGEAFDSAIPATEEMGESSEEESSPE